MLEEALLLIAAVCPGNCEGLGGLHAEPQPVVKVIAHQEQRYETTGDYWHDGQSWQFRVSKMAHPDFELLVLVHELVEWRWVQAHGIPVSVIDAFDIEFEGARVRGEHSADAEPGDDPRAPYHEGHQLASRIEKLCAVLLGIDWQEYEAAFPG